MALNSSLILGFYCFVCSISSFSTAIIPNEENFRELQSLTLENFPRNEDTCSNEFSEFYGDVGDEYDHVFDLSDKAKLMWSVVNISDNEKLSIKGKIAFDGLFSWLALGFAGDNMDKNAMHGGNILMAISNEALGKEQDSPEAEINEYIIHQDFTPFQYWSTPYEYQQHQVEANVEETECTVSLTFSTDSISGKQFGSSPSSLTDDGVDRIIWAANEKNAGSVTYHGHDNRGIFYVNWKDGVAWLDEKSNDESHDGHDHDHSHDSEDEKEEMESSSALSKSSLSATIFLLILLPFTL